MERWNRDHVVRAVVTLVILLSGLAMIPFIDLPAGAISWEQLAGVYSPTLEVNETSGAPGSIFAFTGSGYPALRQATIYVNGDAVGQLQTDGAGQAAFALNTVGAIPGIYNVTLEVDVNASATQSVELVDGGTVVAPPAGFTGTVFFVNDVLLMPVIKRN